MDGVKHLLNGKRLTDDMRMVKDGILHVGTNLFTQQLRVAVPHNGVTVHRHDRILLVIDQRVADGLHINTVGPHLMIGMHHPIDGIRIDVIGKDLEGISVHKERVTL